MFDSKMKMEVQIKRVCSSAWYQLHNISKIRQQVTAPQAYYIPYDF